MPFISRDPQHFPLAADLPPGSPLLQGTHFQLWASGCHSAPRVLSVHMFNVFIPKAVLQGCLCLHMLGQAVSFDQQRLAGSDGGTEIFGSQGDSWDPKKQFNDFSSSAKTFSRQVGVACWGCACVCLTAPCCWRGCFFSRLSGNFSEERPLAAWRWNTRALPMRGQLQRIIFLSFFPYLAFWFES